MKQETYDAIVAVIKKQLNEGDVEAWIETLATDFPE